MLQNFLWFFPLKSGVYFIALLSVFASCGLMVTDVRFLEHSGMNQGNFGVKIVFLLAALLLLNGVYQVSESSGFFLSFKVFHKTNQNLFPCLSLESNVLVQLFQFSLVNSLTN